MALLLSCKSTPTPAPVADPGASSVRVPDGPVASKAPPGAFVIFTGDVTHVVPLDPSADVQAFPGWFIAEAGGRARVHYDTTLEETDAGDGVLRLPYCVDTLEQDACGDLDRSASVKAVATLDGDGMSVTVHADDERACDCVSVEWLSDEGAERYYEALREAWEIDEEEISTSQYDVEEYVRRCYLEEVELSPVAYLGGVAQFHEMLSPVECTGFNNYSLVSRTIEFRAGTQLPDVEVSDAYQCAEDLDLSYELDQDEGCLFSDDDCCAGAGEGVATWIEAGMLVRYAGDVEPVGRSCGCVNREPVSTQTCPSVYDPCGNADGFPSLLDALQWWAATDGSAAIAVMPAGEVHVYGRDGSEPHRVEDLGLEDTSILGVEFVPALPSREHVVPEVIGVRVPKATGAPGRSWGDLCFKRFKEGKLELAEAACVQGLLETHDDDKVRGALTYSLGRIEEARGHQARARLLYARSLRLRPGHTAVQARLDGLK